MSNKIAFLFPGQGSQFVGMGKDLYENYPAAKKVFDKADEVLGKSITKLCFEGPEESLKQTVNTQPAIVTMSIAALEVLKSKLNITPHFTAGHSLGEYCAMFCSGVMDLKTTFKAIQKRASLMSEVKGGMMAAVLNAPEGAVERAIEEASKIGYIDIANYNSPVQVVLTGDENAVKKAGELLLKSGARKFVPLAVSGAFHSKYVEDAGKHFEKFVSDLDLNDAKIPVITNVDAKETTLSYDFREKMPKQMYSSVHWTQTIQKMVTNGVDTFIEIGPGKVLAGLNKKIAPETKVYNVYDKESLENTVSSLKELLAVA
ncbi:ACP S-malonyltransferase [bacterium]|nr:ACP S-malonyltransferase [bacterium]